MNNEFKVGEIATLCNAYHFTEYNNMECEVLTPLTPQVSMNLNSMERATRPSHLVQFPDGMKLNALPHQLRKKKPPTKLRERKTELENDLCTR